MEHDLLSSQLRDHICLSLFLDSLFCSIPLYGHLYDNVKVLISAVS